MRQKLEAVSLETHQVKTSEEDETAQHQNFLVKLQEYRSELRRGTGLYLQLAQEPNIRSDARLSDLTDSLATDIRTTVDADLAQEDRGYRDGSPSLQDGHPRESDNGLSGANDETQSHQVVAPTPGERQLSGDSGKGLFCSLS